MYAKNFLRVEFVKSLMRRRIILSRIPAYHVHIATLGRRRLYRGQDEEFVHECLPNTNANRNENSRVPASIIRP